MGDPLHLTNVAVQSLESFLKEPSPPAAKAVAIALFVCAIPDDLEGKHNFLTSARKGLRDAVDARGTLTINRNDLALVEKMLAILRDSSLLTDEEQRAFSSRFTTGSEKSADGDDLNGWIRVPVPVGYVSGNLRDLCEAVSELSPDPAITTRRSGFGQLLEILIKPEPGSSPRGFVWNNSNTRPKSFATVEDVACHALAAATTATGTGGRERCMDSHRFQISASELEIDFGGESLGLGFAGAFACALLHWRNPSRKVRPRDDYAWTGEVSSTGAVKNVEERTLLAKALAADREGLRGIVVPAAQESRLRAELRSLGSPLDVVGVERLEELLANSDLLKTWSVPANFSPATSRLRWFVAGAALIVAAVLLAIHFGWISLHEDGLSPDSRRLTLHDRTYEPGGIIQFYEETDSLTPGQTEPFLVIGVSASSSGDPGRILRYDMSTREVVWEHRFTRSGLPAEIDDPNDASRYLNVKCGAFGNLDEDPEHEMLVGGSLHPAWPAMIWLFGDPDLPTRVGYHAGHIEEIVASDVDRDGRDEIIAYGFHQPTHGLAVTVWRSDDLFPYDPKPYSDSAWAAWEPELPCLAQAIIPVPRWFPESDSTAIHRVAELVAMDSPGGVIVQGGIGFTADKRADVIFSIDPVRRTVDLRWNDIGVTRQKQWLRDGIVNESLLENGSLESWERSVRFFGSVQIQAPPPVE